MTEPGWYWVRFFPDDSEWVIARFEGGLWWLVGVADGMPRVAEVGEMVGRYNRAK